jgi:hypothetical protein
VEQVPSGPPTGITTGRSINCRRIFGSGVPFDEQLKICDSWNKNHFINPSPYTAILLAMSYAAEQMAADGDFGAGNYYDRLGISAAFVSRCLVATKQIAKVCWRCEALGGGRRTSQFNLTVPISSMVPEAAMPAQLRRCRAELHL